jgi:hypothetical protein
VAGANSPRSQKSAFYTISRLIHAASHGSVPMLAVRFYKAGGACVASYHEARVLETLLRRFRHCRSECFIQTRRGTTRTTFLYVGYHHTSAALVDEEGAGRRCTHSSLDLPSPIYTWP